MDQQIQQRLDALITEIDDSRKSAGRYGKGNYICLMMLGILALLSSVSAGILGIYGAISTQWVGVIALIPAACALTVRTLKLQGKANWHYQKEECAKGMVNRLRFQMPISPSADNVASVAKDWSDEMSKMEEFWRSNLSIDLNPLGTKTE